MCNNIRRYLNNMTQRELAKKVGLTEAALSRYISGDRIPKVTTAIRIAKALGVTVEELFNLIP